METFRSSTLVQGVEIASVTTVGIVSIGAALCCCRKICISCGTRRKEEDDEEKQKEIDEKPPPVKSPTGYVNSAKRLAELMF